MPTPVNGLIVLDQRFTTTDNLAAQGVGTLNSSYQEAGPIPGTVTQVSAQRLVPMISGDQQQDVSLYINKGGTRDNRVSYSLDDGTTYRGYVPLSLASYGPVVLTGTHDYQLQTLSTTQKVLMSFRYSSSGTGYTIFYAPIDNVTDGAALVSSYCDLGLAVANYDDTHLFAFYADSSDEQLNMSISSDGAVSWTDSNRNIMTVDAATTSLRGAFIGENISLLVEDNVAETIIQYASSDFGRSFTEVCTLSNAINGRVLNTPFGAFFGYIDTSGTNAIKLTSMSSSFTDLSLADFTTIGTSASINSFDICNQGNYLIIPSFLEDVLIYAYEISTGTNYPAAYGWYANDAVSGFVDGSMTYASGYPVCVANATSTLTTYDDYAHFMHFGTVSSIEWSAASRYDWTPIDPPNNLTNWSSVGTTTPTYGAGYMQIATSSQTLNYTYGIGAHRTRVGCHFILNVSSGGSALNDSVAVRVLFTNDADTAKYYASIRFNTAGFLGVDNYGSTFGATALDMTSDREFLVWTPAQGKLSVAYKSPTDLDWTLAIDSQSLTSNTTAVNSTLGFGTFASSTNTSQWKMFSAMETPYVYTSYEDFTGILISPSPVAVPGIGDDANELPGYLRMVGGPSFTGENYTIPVGYQYGIAKCLPGSTPTPSQEWRSTDLTEQVITFDLGATSFIGNGAGVYIQDANFKTAYLEYYNGSSWSSVGTWNAAYGFGSVNYTCSGDTARPDTGTAGSRFIGMNELKGGWVDFGGSDQYAILGNSGGFWSSSANTRPQVRLDTSFTGTGTCDLCWPTGLLLVYSTTTIRARYWRLRIPAQVCVDPYFKASVIALGRIQPFGQAWGWGWSDTESPNYVSHTDYSGSETRKSVGKSQRQWSVGFTDGLSTTSLRSSATNAAVAVSGGASLGSQNDVAWMIRGIIEETDQCSIPVIACSKLDGSTGSPGVTLTDPSIFLYGYLSGTLSVQHVSGIDGVDEVQRVETINISEVI